MGKVLIIKGADFSANKVATIDIDSVSPPTITISQSGVVTLSGTSPIYYTTDGSTPSASSNLYTVPFTIPDETTVKAVCIESGEMSSVVMKEYSTKYSLTWLKAYYNADGNGEFVDSGPNVYRFICCEKFAALTASTKLHIGSDFAYRVCEYNTDGTFIQANSWSSLGNEETIATTVGHLYSITIKGKTATTEVPLDADTDFYAQAL